MQSNTSLAPDNRAVGIVTVVRRRARGWRAAAGVSQAHGCSRISHPYGSAGMALSFTDGAIGRSSRSGGGEQGAVRDVDGDSARQSG